MRKYLYSSNMIPTRMYLHQCRNVCVCCVVCMYNNISTILKIIVNCCTISVFYNCIIFCGLSSKFIAIVDCFIHNTMALNLLYLTSSCYSTSPAYHVYCVRATQYARKCTLVIAYRYGHTVTAVQ